jgi:hypothetical protein
MIDERGEHGGEDATEGGGASADRGRRDAGMPGPDPEGKASGPGTGGSPRSTDAQDRGSNSGSPGHPPDDHANGSR